MCASPAVRRRLEVAAAAGGLPGARFVDGCWMDGLLIVHRARRYGSERKTYGTRESRPHCYCLHGWRNVDTVFVGIVHF